MQEIDQITSEGQSSYWGESWASCDDELQDFVRRQKKMEARYDTAMEDGGMSAMESGRVFLKAYSVASTLSKASKKGCEWVTNKSIDSSSMDRIMAKTMKEQKCVGAAKDVLEKAMAAGESPDEAKVKAQKIMLSVDCKVPKEDIVEAQKSFKQLAKMEEAAEAGALSEIQKFKSSLDAGPQASLVETDSGVVPVAVLLYWLLFCFTYAMWCTVVYTVLATLLTMVFLGLKAAFKFALGYSSGADFQAEMGQIMKPMFTLVATGCAALGSTVLLYLGALVGSEMVAWMGLAGIAGSMGVGGKSLATQAGLIGPDTAEEVETTTATETEKTPCKPKSTSTVDPGHWDRYRGWYDVQGCGRCNDYCRWVGNSGSGGDPLQKTVHEESWWSCRLAGDTKPYTPAPPDVGAITTWRLSKCKSEGAVPSR